MRKRQSRTAIRRWRQLLDRERLHQQVFFSKRSFLSFNDIFMNYQFAGREFWNENFWVNRKLFWSEKFIDFQLEKLRSFSSLMSLHSYNQSNKLSRFFSHGSSQNNEIISPRLKTQRLPSSNSCFSSFTDLTHNWEFWLRLMRVSSSWEMGLKWI